MDWIIIVDILACVATTIAILLLLFGLYRFGWLMTRWRTASQLYGPAHWSVGIDVYQFSKFGRLATLRWIGTLGLFVVMLPLIGEALSASVEHRYVWDGGRWHWAAWVTLLLAYLTVWAVVECELAIPPAILLLGPSSPELERELSALNRQLPGCRTLGLLRPGTAQLTGLDRWGEYANNLRTRDLYQWRSIVFQLMDVVPVVILCDDVTEPVVEESRRIARCGYQSRTYETTRVRMADPSEHERLKAWLAERLTTVSDQVERCERQFVFDMMRGTLPAYLRYPASVEGFVERAAGLLKLGGYRFLKLCKRIDPAQVEGGLIEDVPSAATREEELRFLRNDRVFEEMDILFDSVQESIVLRGREQDEYLRESAAKRAQFNAYPGGGSFLTDMFDRVEGAVELARRRLRLKVGNLTVKRGQLARYRGEWELAERTLRQAIDELHPLSFDSDPFIKQEALCELGTAYFYLGDIALARHRESGDQQLLGKAVTCYEASVNHDSMGDGDTSPARRRLAMLKGETIAPQAPEKTTDQSGQPDLFKSNRQVAFRAFRGIAIGAVMGGIASLLAIPFVPDGQSVAKVVLLYMFGTAGLGVFVEMQRLNRAP